MYWTFLCLLWQQCPSLLAVLWKHFLCRFFYLLHVCVCAARFCNVLCCVVKLMKMFSYFACVLTTCMCFLKLLCVELSGPPYILRWPRELRHTTLLWLVVGLSNWAKRHFFSWFGWNTPHNHSPMERYHTHILTRIMSMTTSGYICSNPEIKFNTFQDLFQDPSATRSCNWLHQRHNWVWDFKIKWSLPELLWSTASTQQNSDRPGGNKAQKNKLSY